MIRDLYLATLWTWQRWQWRRANQQIRPFHPAYYPFVQLAWEWKARLARWRKA